jgi:hypothetical protein
MEYLCALTLFLSVKAIFDVVIVLSNLISDVAVVGVFPDGLGAVAGWY